MAIEGDISSRSVAEEGKMKTNVQEFLSPDSVQNEKRLSYETFDLEKQSASEEKKIDTAVEDQKEEQKIVSNRYTVSNKTNSK